MCNRLLAEIGLAEAACLLAGWPHQSSPRLAPRDEVMGPAAWRKCIMSVAVGGDIGTCTGTSMYMWNGRVENAVTLDANAMSGYDAAQQCCKGTLLYTRPKKVRSRLYCSCEWFMLLQGRAGEGDWPPAGQQLCGPGCSAASRGPNGIGPLRCCCVPVHGLVASVTIRRRLLADSPSRPWSVSSCATAAPSARLSFRSVSTLACFIRPLHLASPVQVVLVCVCAEGLGRAPQRRPLEPLPHFPTPTASSCPAVPPESSSSERWLLQGHPAPTRLRALTAALPIELPFPADCDSCLSPVHSTLAPITTLNPSSSPTRAAHPCPRLLHPQALRPMRQPPPSPRLVAN